METRRISNRESRDREGRRMRTRVGPSWMAEPFLLALLIVLFSFGSRAATLSEGTLTLDALVDEALKNSPEIQVLEARARAAGYRIPLARSLPDPMFMFGYQNEGFRRLTIGKEPNAQGMFGASQMFYFPGKRDLKGEMATRDAESIAAEYRGTMLKVTSRVKEGFFDLFLAYKILDILGQRTDIFTMIEDAAAARYSGGMGSQQEVVMAQTEKYMLLEKEEMQKQKIQALQGIINSLVGREVNLPLGRPEPPPSLPYALGMEDLLDHMKTHSPELAAKQKMVESAEAKVKMAKKEYYPDVTLNAGYYPRTEGFLDMWSLTATVNIPLYFRSKQRQAVFEADTNVVQAKRELAATEFMISSAVRENYSMMRTAEKLMALYREGLIPKTEQDIQLALSGYVTGKTEALTVITRLRNLIDAELLYWMQYTEREKAMARLHAITGTVDDKGGQR